MVSVFRIIGRALRYWTRGVIRRSWIRDVLNGNPRSRNAPPSWLEWVDTGSVRALLATRSLEYRTRVEQLPQAQGQKDILDTICRYFHADHHAFERFAASLANLLLPSIANMELTRPSRDGGRDAIGQLRIGHGPSSILVSFALEAKCYSIHNGVGVRHLSRLISRLRHRQFGILVTTSYVSLQAYREIREDHHPIIVLAGVDIVRLLRDDGLTTAAMVRERLQSRFPLDV